MGTPTHVPIKRCGPANAAQAAGAASITEKPALTVPFHSSARRCPARCSGTAARPAAPRPARRPGRGTASPSAAPRRPRLPRRRGSSSPPRPTRSARTTRARVQHEDRLLVAGAERRQPRRHAAPARSSRRRPPACPRPAGRPPRAAPRRRPGARSGTHGSAEPRRARSENPAAIACPPPVARMPAWRAAIDRRAEVDARAPTGRSPWPIPSAMPATQAGRLNRSLIRPATMPTTPGCQPSPLDQQRGAPGLQPAPRRPARRRRASPASTSWRWRFTASSRSARARASAAILAQQQPQPEIGLADPPAGVDARAQRRSRR